MAIPDGIKPYEPLNSVGSVACEEARHSGCDGRVRFLGDHEGIPCRCPCHRGRENLTDKERAKREVTRAYFNQLRAKAAKGGQDETLRE